MVFWRLISLFMYLLMANGAVAAPDLLEPAVAFRLSTAVTQDRVIEVRFDVEPGYYLYRERFKVASKTPEVKLGAMEIPPGKKKTDQFLGEVETHRGAVVIRVPFEAPATVATADIVVSSQGCADAGVCYLPQDQPVKVALVASASAPAGNFTGIAGSADDTRFAQLFRGDLWLLVASFFGFGLLLSFTPCVFPMIPILSGIIAGGGHRMTRSRGLALSAAYVLGMALTYAVAGVAAGLSGVMLSAALQNPWVLGTFSALFVVLAGGMLGWYELQLPAVIQERFAAASNRLHGGHVAGVFGMGALSALIVGPCVAAPLAGALLYISQTRDAVLGASALFSMAIGMGVPLLLVGASAGALLPKSGPWMDTVKRLFGVILLGVAIYVASPVLSVPIQMYAWAALFVFTGVFLGAFDPLPRHAHASDRVAKALGVISIVAGLAYLVGGLSGNGDVTRPLAGLRVSGNGSEAPHVQFQRVANPLELKLALAAAGGRPVMLDFYADWCVSCKEMERDTFPDERVRSRLDQMLLLQADVTANSADHRALLQQFQLFGPPGIVFYDRSGALIQDLRVVGFQSPELFAGVLDRALGRP